MWKPTPPPPATDDTPPPPTMDAGLMMGLALPWTLGLCPPRPATDNPPLIVQE